MYGSGFNCWNLEFVHYFTAGVGKKCDEASLDLLNAFASVGHG